VIDLNFSILEVELVFVLLLSGFEGFLIALHKAAMESLFVSIRSSLEFNNDNSIAFIFNGLNG
jgi:hypothetical protein